MTVPTTDFIAEVSIVGAVNSSSSKGAFFLQMAVTATGCVTWVILARHWGSVAALRLFTNLSSVLFQADV